ncbi:hypothetical protein [Thauera aminoaromatica]|uniref:hypothetical protein n=1 Tax=Thauera aminoaromatica TaxID=164330 RepID=UPI0012FB4A2D|nr:hypothetical protein [Thauera aminoaromatica]
MTSTPKTNVVALAAETTITESAAAVLAHQAQVAALDTEIETLTAAIAEQNGKAAALRQALPNVSVLDERMDDLLADVAIGKATDEAVTQLEAERRDARETVERIRPELDRFARTVAALERKAEDARVRVRQLKEDKPALMRRFLMDEAQDECRRYIDDGLRAARSYKRLRALDALLEQAGSNYPLCASRETMVLPGFNLAASEEAPCHPVLKGIVFKVDGRFDGGTVLQRAAEERAALRERYGVEF